MRNKLAKAAKTARRTALTAMAPDPFFAGSRGPELKFAPLEQSNQQLNHDVPTNLLNATSILDAITVGSSSTQRVGARIRLKSFALRAVLNSKADRPNVSYRVMVTLSPQSTELDTLLELLTGNYFTGGWIPGRCKVLADEYVTPSLHSVTELGSGATQKERTVVYSREWSLDGAVNYTGAVAMTKLQVFIVPYDAYGTLTTDIIASVPVATGVMYYTDD